MEDMLNDKYKLGYSLFNNNCKLDPDEYEEIFKRQNGLCAICKKECTRHKRLSVDHNHNTNIARGLLCENCNLGIGKLMDDVEILQSAINYLKE